jgi:hypothetical protein
MRAILGASRYVVVVAVLGCLVMFAAVPCRAGSRCASCRT